MENLAQVLQSHAKRSPHKVAISFKGIHFTYQQLDENVEAIACGLAQLGIGTGSKIAYVQPNWPDFALLGFALARVGATGIPLSTFLRTTELKHIVMHSEAQLLVVPAEFMGFDYVSFYRNIRDSLPLLENIIVIGDNCSQGIIPFDDIIKGGRGSKHSRHTTSQNEPAAIFYTSGTTGQPKGVMTSHNALMGSARSMAALLGINSDDVVLSLLPMSHAAGYLNFLWAIVSGARTVLIDIFDPQHILDVIANERVTITSHVPSGWIRIIESARKSSHDLSSLRRVIMTGAPCPPPLIEELADVAGCEVDITYGQTEALMLTMTTLVDDPEERINTVGKPIPGVEIKIVDQNSQELGIGKVGEILCRAYNTTLGYYKDPDRTKAIMDNKSWLHTRDLGNYDEKGCLRILGRKDDIIITRGFNVYPREVEELLMRHPKIANAAVIGLPDKSYGEILCAYIVAKSEDIPTEEEIINFCSDQIAYYKIPKQIKVVAELPMTPSGKIRRFELRGMVNRE